MKCGNTRFYRVEKRLLYQCTQCKKQHSITAGTLFHRSHLPLLKWFWAIYLISRDKRGYSALSLKNALNVSYPTAWLLFQKIRTAMANKEKDYTLTGVAVIDDAYFGSVKNNHISEDEVESTKVLVAVSLNQSDKPLFAKMEIIKNLEDETISTALSKMIESGHVFRSNTCKLSPNLSRALSRADYVQEIIVSSMDEERAKTIFKWVNIIIANAKSYILGTYHGLPAKHLGKYLMEYCYRFNRRFCEHIIFGKLINACIITTPITYTELTL
jgi:hypothetical protein